MTDLLQLIEAGQLTRLFNEKTIVRVCIAVFQVCLRTLLVQSSDGSWDGSLEMTAYAVLTLAEARRLCFFGSISVALELSIKRAVSFLATAGKALSSPFGPIK